MVERPHAAKRRRLAVMASILAVGLLGGAIWIASNDAQQRAAQAPRARDPQLVTIQRPDRIDIVLQRGNDEWRITEPCALAVNEQRLSPLFEALNAPGTRYNVDEVDLSATGLNAPSATLIVDGQRIDIGELDVSGSRRYLRSDQTVELAPEWILSLVDGGLTAFAATPVFDAEVSEASADETALDAEVWTDLQADQTLTWPLADALPVNHRVSDVAVTLADGTLHRVQITSTDDWHALVIDEAGCARILPPDALPSFGNS